MKILTQREQFGHYQDFNRPLNDWEHETSQEPSFLHDTGFEHEVDHHHDPDHMRDYRHGGQSTLPTREGPTGQYPGYGEQKSFVAPKPAVNEKGKHKPLKQVTGPAYDEAWGRHQKNFGDQLRRQNFPEEDVQERLEEIPYNLQHAGRRILTAREQYDTWWRLGADEDDSDPLNKKQDQPQTDPGQQPHAPAGGTPGGEPATWSMPSAIGVPGSAPSSPGTPSAPTAPSGVGGPSGPTQPYSSSGGAAQWDPQIDEALRRNNLPVSLEKQVEHQVQTESSGNPNAINNTDSNAIAGHPSQGLAQTIPSTFEHYNLPGDSHNITDPQANLDAAVGYAKSTYGPTLMNNGKGMGSGHGY